MPEATVYEKLVKLLSDGTMPLRTAFLRNKMEMFLNACGASSYAIVNDNLLLHVSIDYFADIARLKPFHEIEYTNKEKIIAYTAYWICRRKPIQLTGKKVDNINTFINEAFVAFFISDELAGLTGSAVPNKLKEQLYYHLKYRVVDAQTFELMINHYIMGRNSTNMPLS